MGFLVVLLSILKKRFKKVISFFTDNILYNKVNF